MLPVTAPFAATTTTAVLLAPTFNAIPVLYDEPPEISTCVLASQMNDAESLLANCK
jgi:hypothetical protein